jgi:spermidine/putrescine transport system substrate-binding protein
MNRLNLKFSAFVAVSFLLFASFACTRSSSQSSTSAPKVVQLAIWSNYLSPETIALFEKQTGIQVKVSNYSSNEELLAKLQAGASGYDVVVPSDYMIHAMVELKLLKELDYSQLPNAKFLDAQYLKKPFDPTNRYSLPYDWGTTGIAVNRDLYKGTIRGWKDLFENPELAGKLTLLDDSREVMAAALKSLGYSLNSKKPEEIAAAKALLLKARSRVKAFTSEPLMPLVNGETAVAHAYSSDALQAREKTGGKVEYIIPAEGGTIWIDNLVIPAGAKNLKEAHAFINFMLEPKTLAATINQIYVGPANREAYGLLSKKLQSDPALFPAPAVRSKLEGFEDLGPALKLWDRAWTEIKAN